MTAAAAAEPVINGLLDRTGRLLLDPAGTVRAWTKPTAAGPEPVTDLDTQVEALLVDGLTSAFPHATIFQSLSGTISPLPSACPPSGLASTASTMTPTSPR